MYSGACTRAWDSQGKAHLWSLRANLLSALLRRSSALRSRRAHIALASSLCARLCSVRLICSCRCSCLLRLQYGQQQVATDRPRASAAPVRHAERLQAGPFSHSGLLIVRIGFSSAAF